MTLSMVSLLAAAAVVSVASSIVGQMDKWREGKRWQAGIFTTLSVLGVVIAYAVLYQTGRERSAQVTGLSSELVQVREDHTAQSKRLSEQLALQQRDQDDAQAAQYKLAKLIAEGCISDRSLRGRARAVHRTLARSLSIESRGNVSFTAEVTKGKRNRPEPSRLGVPKR